EKMRRTNINAAILNSIINNKIFIYTASKNILIQLTTDTILKNESINEFINIIEIINNDTQIIDVNYIKNIGHVTISQILVLFLIHMMICQEMKVYVLQSNSNVNQFWLTKSIFTHVLDF